MCVCVGVRDDPGVKGCREKGPEARHNVVEKRDEVEARHSVGDARHSRGLLRVLLVVCIGRWELEEGRVRECLCLQLLLCGRKRGRVGDEVNRDCSGPHRQ